MNKKRLDLYIVKNELIEELKKIDYLINKRPEQKETVQEKQEKPQFSIAGLRQRQQEIDNKNQLTKIKKKSR